MFENKVAVVTGGAKGIGKAIAGEFRKAGASVCVIDLLPICDFMGEGFEISPLPRGASSGNAFVRMTLNNGR